MAVQKVVTLELEFQDASGCPAVPPRSEFAAWLEGTLEDRGDVSVTVRIVDEAEMRALNNRYRGRDKATNVLSFEADLPETIRGEIQPEPLGDIVICAPVVEAEAELQGKPPRHHWAHLCIHGLLHLLGHDHDVEERATVMESLEVKYLSRLGIPDPYELNSG